MAESRDELAIGEPRGRFAADAAGRLVVLPRLPDESFQAFAHGTGTEDEQVVARRQAIRDMFDKSIEVLEAVRLAGGLRRPTAAVADAGIVPDMAGGPVVGRHLGLHPLESRPVVLPADDDGLPRIDPHEGAGLRHVISRLPVPAEARRHECAQAGPVSTFTAKSA